MTSADISPSDRTARHFDSFTRERDAKVALGPAAAEEVTDG